MATKCKVSDAVKLMGVNPLNNTVTVDLTIIDPIQACARIRTNAPYSYIGDSYIYNKFDKPDDELNCLANRCFNTGTATIGVTEDTIGEETVYHAKATYTSISNAENYDTGAITYYVYLPKAGTYTITTEIADIKDTSFTNADIYTKEITVTEAGFQSIVVDLLEVPSAVEGNGWTASKNGVIMEITIDSDVLVVGDSVGISTINMFSSTEDFKVNDTVRLSCIDTIDGDYTIDPLDNTCWGSTYDTSTIAIEKTLTASSATPNYWKLSPIIEKGEKTEGFVIETTKQEVQEVTIDGIRYGYIQATDLNIDECGFTLAYVNDECDVMDAYLERVSSPVPIALNENDFMVLDNIKTNPSDLGKFLFNEIFIGKEITISYPRRVDAVHYVGNENVLQQRRVRMAVTNSFINSEHKQVKVYNNILITSFPDALTSDATTFSFTFNMQKDNNGQWFEFYDVSQVD